MQSWYFFIAVMEQHVQQLSEMAVCLLRMQVAWGYAWQQKFGMEGIRQSHQGWIFYFFAASSERCREKGRDSGGWGHDCIGHPLTFTATSLAWSVAEISQIWAQERFVTEVKTDRGGEDEGEKHLAAGTVSVLVWRKSWHKLHLSVVIGEDFQSVIQWCTKMGRAATTDRILVYFSSHSGYVAVHWMRNTLGMVAVFIKYTDEVNPGKSHYHWLSSLIQSILIAMMNC